MRTNRIWVGMLALGIAKAAWATPSTPQQPPAQWAEYIAAVRKSDTIADEEARCLAHPDLPGNEWLPEAAKWRCSVLRKPMLSLDEIDKLLQQDAGSVELDRRFAALLDANYKDQQQRDQIFNAFSPFDENPRAAEIAARWLKQSPKSAFANAALAFHHEAAGWEARGENLARETPKTQLERMTREFAIAVPLNFKALEIEPRLSPACTSLAAIGRQSSDDLQRYAMAVCTKVDPDSYFLALERIYGAQPKWGGSDEELRLAVAYAEARVQKNPMMGALLGEVAGYRPSTADNYGDVVEELAAAARMAPSGRLSAKAARGYRVNGDEWAALVYISQALRFGPRDADRRYQRAGRLMTLGEYEWAFRDMQVALELEPDDGWHQYRMGQIAHELNGVTAGRPYFRRALDFPDSRRAAMVKYCAGYISEKASTEAGKCTRDFVAEYPTDGEAWRQRFWYLVGLGAVRKWTRPSRSSFVMPIRTMRCIRKKWQS